MTTARLTLRHACSALKVSKTCQSACGCPQAVQSRFCEMRQRPSERALYFSMISQHRAGVGCVGVLPNRTHVAPLSSGPYVRYVWPVIQPQSAVHLPRAAASSHGAMLRQVSRAPGVEPSHGT